MLIALVTVAVVVIGGVGLLVGQALHTKQASGQVVTPGDTGGGTTGTTPGTTPTTGTSGTTGTTGSTATTATSAPPGGTAGGTTSSSVTLGNGVVTVPIPAGWQADPAEDKTSVVITHGPFLAAVAILGPHADAAAVVAEAQKGFLATGYSQLQTDPLKTFKPSGTETSLAYVVYSGLRSDSGSSVSVVGNIFGVVRADKVSAVIWLETSANNVAAAGDALVKSKEITSVLDGTLDDFSSR